MSQELKEIKSGIGLGSLKFGMSREEVKAMLGEPSETEVSSFVDEEVKEEISLETWHFDDVEMSVGFDEEVEWKVISIGVSADDVQLFDKRIMGLSKEELAESLQEEVADLVIEDVKELEDTTSELMSSEKLGINFWFDEDELVEIQWGPHFNADESIEWPQ